MKYYVIEDSWIPKALSWFINIWAITLYPFIICRGKLDQRTRTHEVIHLHQQKELWLIGFYILYVAYWIRYLVAQGNFSLAYACIPFEREAYDNDNDPTYPLRRKRFSWTKYLKE
jgi:hypothetical protein|tara:strand:+ start:503 stop:847 length:345 start_codon:yes stop_codon:yes gene_type:complete